MNRKFKRNAVVIITLLAIMLSIITPNLTVLADEEDANVKFNKAVDSYIGDSEEFTDVIELIEKDSKNVKNPNKNTMPHVMKRLFGPKEYLNDMEYGVISKDLNVKKKDILVDGKYACNPNAPNNLINHNCNIPNFTTGLIQNIAKPFSNDFHNAGTTSSYATFGLGIPKNIPGDTVPVNPGNRAHQYTAMELFGYDLKITTYNGEWDKIDVSNQARMLSNFGLIDKFTLMGTGLWNSVKSGIGGLIENFQFKPSRWISSHSRIFNRFLSGGLNTVIDTSDLNIVATNGWKRDSFSGSLYNVYVLTDKEVLLETNKGYFREFIKELQKKAEASPELLEVLALEQIPGFTFEPDWETEDSIKARESASNRNDSERSKADADPEYEPSYEDVPEPVYYTEKEQLGFWGEENQSMINRAARQGLISNNPDDYETYEELIEEWNDAWNSYFQREFNALGPVVDELLKKSDTDVFTNNPHLDPKQPISHYACANEDGSIMRDKNGGVEYLYLKNNQGSNEYLNPKCSPTRSPIGGGLFGSGWHIDKNEDTRHVNSVKFGHQIPIQSWAVSISRSIASFFAKVTNTVLGFSFSPIMDELGITTIIVELVEGFKKTIFFPLASLFIAIGAVMLFFQILRNRGVWQLFISLFVTLLIFVAGATFLMNPEGTLNLVDNVPNKLDNWLASVVMVDDDGNSYCSTGAEDGIRSAQCNVWGAMVFNPWVNIQFGAGYNDLFANGHAPKGGNEFKNTNESLVGDASVYMGNGHTEHNWALYQLDKTKSGTINELPNGPVGRVNKDLYRLVDLQAGPNNGAGTDSTYFSTWALSDESFTLMLLTFIQSLAMMIAIVGIGYNKIEVSLFFSLSIVFLPFMLLYSLIPQGRGKLKGYLGGLGNLLVKRFVIVIMMSVFLKILNLSYSRIDSLFTSTLVVTVICTTFVMYKKELFNLFTPGTENGGSMVKEFMSNSFQTKGMNQSIRTMKTKTSGAISGFAGGALGATQHRELKRRRLGLEREHGKLSMSNILKNEEKETKIKARQAEIEKELVEINEELDIMKDTGLNTFKSGIYGARGMSQTIGAKTERSLRKEGFSKRKSKNKIKDAVISEGAKEIRTKEDPTAFDTYREVLSHSESIRSKTSEQTLTGEDAMLLMDPKVQKEVRRLSKERDELAQDNLFNPDYTAVTQPIDEFKLKVAAELIDEKRGKQDKKLTIRNPFLKHELKEEKKSQIEHRKTMADTKIIKEELQEQVDLKTKEIEDKRKRELAKQALEEEAKNEHKEEEHEEEKGNV